MSGAQNGRFRATVLVISLLFGLLALGLGFNLRQLAHVPQEAALQAAIASMQLDELERATRGSPSSAPVTVADRAAALSQDWKARLSHLDEAVANIVHLQSSLPSSEVEQTGVRELNDAWQTLRPAVETLTATPPPYFSRTEADGTV